MNYKQTVQKTLIALVTVAVAIVTGCNFSKLPRKILGRDANSTIEFNQKSQPAIQLLYTLTRHSDAVRSVAISSNGQILASGSWDKTINIWQLATGKLLQTLSEHKAEVESIAISPNGQILASGDRNGQIKLWHLGSGKLLRTLTAPPIDNSKKGNSIYPDPINCVTFSADGQTLASGGGNIRLWQVDSGKLRLTLYSQYPGASSVVFSPDGQKLASSLGRNIQLWQLSTGKPLYTLYVPTSTVGTSGTIYQVKISPDGQTLVSNSDDTTIKLWQLSTGKLLRTLSRHSSPVYAVAISSDGQTLASAGYKVVKLWYLSTGRVFHNLTGQSSMVNAVAFSPDGRTLVSGNFDNTIKVWRLSP